MNAPKFTPGPWECIELTGEVYVEAPTKQMIFGPMPISADACVLGDARLIAAAPELYEALHVMVDKATRQNWNDAYPEQLAQAQAALAKAAQP